MITCNQLNTLLVAASETFGVSKEKIMQTRRHRCVISRQTIMKYLCDNTKMSLSEIGKVIGNKDHATVLHARRTIEGFLEVDKKYKKDYSRFCDFVKKINQNLELESSVIE